MRSTRARACTGKKKHATREEALVHLKRLVDGGASARILEAYECRHCKGWHVGHVKRRRGPV